MNSADAWHEGESNLEALLGLSVELAQTMKEADMEAAKERHPAGKGLADVPAPGHAEGRLFDVLTAADRCDADCSAGALYRITLAGSSGLDFCHHHHGRFFPQMEESGWEVVGTNPSLMEELYGGRNRHQGSEN